MAYLHIPLETLDTRQRDYYNDARYGRAGNITAAHQNGYISNPDVSLTVNREGALHITAHQNAPKTMAAILEAGANPNLQDSGKQTALLIASHQNNPEMVTTLLAHKADPNIPDQNGNTPLHWAAYWGDVKQVDQLIAAGAEVNVTNNRGENPLQWSTANRDSSVTRHLIAHGANKTIKDDNDLTATDHANRRQKPDLADWLTRIEPKNVIPIVIPPEPVLTQSLTSFRQRKAEKIPKVALAATRP